MLPNPSPDEHQSRVNALRARDAEFEVAKRRALNSINHTLSQSPDDPRDWEEELGSIRAALVQGPCTDTLIKEVYTKVYHHMVAGCKKLLLSQLEATARANRSDGKFHFNPEKPPIDVTDEHGMLTVPPLMYPLRQADPASVKPLSSWFPWPNGGAACKVDATDRATSSVSSFLTVCDVLDSEDESTAQAATASTEGRRQVLRQCMLKDILGADVEFVRVDEAKDLERENHDLFQRIQEAIEHDKNVALERLEKFRRWKRELILVRRLRASPSALIY